MKPRLRSSWLLLLLLLKLDTGALGEMRVGLLDAAGQPIPGFDAVQCDYVQYNSTDAVVSWGGQPDLASLHGGDVQLIFRSNRTKLYSFRFE